MKSFLICFHDDYAEVYREGLPIGIVTGKHFERHKHKLADGSEKPVTIDGELVGSVQKVVNAMRSEVSPDANG